LAQTEIHKILFKQKEEKKTVKVGKHHWTYSQKWVVMSIFIKVIQVYSEMGGILWVFKPIYRTYVLYFFSIGCHGSGQGKTFQNIQVPSMSKRQLILKPVVISLEISQIG